MAKSKLKRTDKQRGKPSRSLAVELTGIERELLEAITIADLAEGAEDVMRQADQAVLRSLFHKGMFRYREVVMPTQEGSIPRDKIREAVLAARNHRADAEPTNPRQIETMLPSSPSGSDRS